MKRSLLWCNATRSYVRGRAVADPEVRDRSLLQRFYSAGMKYGAAAENRWVFGTKVETLSTNCILFFYEEYYHSGCFKSKCKYVHNKSRI